MKLELTREDGFHLGVTEGPLDDSANGPFRDLLHPLLAEPGVQLIVDISGSRWINSDGLAVLVRLASDAGTRGGRVLYAAPSAFVWDVLQVTRLESYLEVASSRDEAVRWIRSTVAGC